jgi:hypothetical protein
LYTGIFSFPTCLQNGPLETNGTFSYHPLEPELLS